MPSSQLQSMLSDTGLGSHFAWPHSAAVAPPSRTPAQGPARLLIAHALPFRLLAAGLTAVSMLLEAHRPLRLPLLGGGAAATGRHRYRTRAASRRLAPRDTQVVVSGRPRRDALPPFDHRSSSPASRLCRIECPVRGLAARAG